MRLLFTAKTRFDWLCSRARPPRQAERSLGKGLFALPLAPATPNHRTAKLLPRMHSPAAVQQMLRTALVHLESTLLLATWAFLTLVTPVGKLVPIHD